MTKVAPKPVGADEAVVAALRDQRVLVTGAEGYIGGMLLKHLVREGVSSVGTARTMADARALTGDGLAAEALDLAEPGEWATMLRGVDVVIHCAAMFQDYAADIDAYRVVNRDGALRLFDAALAAGVRRFVHVSTVGVHGDVQEVPATEQSPFNPMDIYHETKLEGELALLERAKEVGPERMTLVVNRPAMVYGPADRRLLKLFKLVGEGRFRMVGDGETLAHLGHIDDQIDSLIRCAVAPAGRVHGEVFNIASDTPLTLNDLVQYIADAAGAQISKRPVPVAPVYAVAWACEALCRPLGVQPPLFPRRVGFFTHNRAFDLTKARETLGYISQVSHQRGLAETYQWYAANGWL